MFCKHLAKECSPWNKKLKFNNPITSGFSIDFTICTCSNIVYWLIFLSIRQNIGIYLFEKQTIKNEKSSSVTSADIIITHY